MWARHPVGVIQGLLGLAVLLFLSVTLYRPEERWVSMLAHLSIPVTMLAAVIGASMIGAGIWLNVRRGERSAS